MIEVPDTAGAVIQISDRLREQSRFAEDRDLIRAAAARYAESAEICIRMAVAISDTHPHEAMAWALRAAELATDDPGVQYRVGSLFYDLGDRDLARSALTRAVSIADDDFPLMFELAHLLGLLLADSNETEDSLALLRVAFEGAPEKSEYGEHYVDALVKSGRRAEALAAVRVGIRRHPDDETLRELQAWLMSLEQDGKLASTHAKSRFRFRRRS